MLKLSDSEIFGLADKAVKSYVSKVFRGFFRYDDLEQLVIDVATKVFENRQKYDEKLGTAFNWIYRIAKNATLDAVAKEKRYRSIFTSVALEDRVNDDGYAVGMTPVSSDETDAWLIAKDTERALRGSVSRDREKRLLDGLINGLTSADLAEAERVAPSKIYTPVCHLRSKLKSVA